MSPAEQKVLAVLRSRQTLNSRELKAALPELGSTTISAITRKLELEGRLRARPKTVRSPIADSIDAPATMGAMRPPRTVRILQFTLTEAV